MRPKIDYRTASKEAYNKFCQEHPSTKITFDQFKSILYTWNEMFMTHILETGEKIKFPFGFGHLSINKKKGAKSFVNKDGQVYCPMPIDWVKTKELKKRVYILNNHTDGYRFKWYWFKEGCRIAFKDVWRFKPARKYSTLLNKYLTVKKDKRYMDIYNEWHITR